MTVSPWDDFAEVDSPDGRYTAIFDNAMEIAMGAPTRGILKITAKESGHCIAEISGANASFIWSTDSARLALPQWTRERMQRLMVISIPHGATQILEGEYRVLQLESFQHGLIQGVDSPIYQPAPICLAVDK